MWHMPGRNGSLDGHRRVDYPRETNRMSVFTHSSFVPSVSFLSVFLCLTSGASAQPASPAGAFSATGTDVAGVRLGMSPEEAVAALKSFALDHTVEKLYSNDNQKHYENAGAPMSDFTDSQGKVPYQRTLYLTGISSEKGTRVVCTNGNSFCYSDDHEVILVYLAPTVDHERVIAIRRTKDFIASSAPTIASLKSGLLSKYPMDKISSEDNRGQDYEADWFFDGKKRLISKDRARGVGLYASQGQLPGNVTEGGGLGLSAYIGASSNSLLASSFSIALYDSDGLYKSIGQSKANYDSLKAAADAEDAKKASQSATPTKF
jgi:hypothetical protein